MHIQTEYTDWTQTQAENLIIHTDTRAAETHTEYMHRPTQDEHSHRRQNTQTKHSPQEQAEYTPGQTQSTGWAEYTDRNTVTDLNTQTKETQSWAHRLVYTDRNTVTGTGWDTCEPEHSHSHRNTQTKSTTVLSTGLNTDRNTVHRLENTHRQGNTDTGTGWIHRQKHRAGVWIHRQKETQSQAQGWDTHRQSTWSWHRLNTPEQNTATGTDKHSPTVWIHRQKTQSEHRLVHTDKNTVPQAQAEVYTDRAPQPQAQTETVTSLNTQTKHSPEHQAEYTQTRNTVLRHRLNTHRQTQSGTGWIHLNGNTATGTDKTPDPGHRLNTLNRNTIHRHRLDHTDKKQPQAQTKHGLIWIHRQKHSPQAQAEYRQKHSLQFWIHWTETQSTGTRLVYLNRNTATGTDKYSHRHRLNTHWTNTVTRHSPELNLRQKHSHRQNLEPELTDRHTYTGGYRCWYTVRIKTEKKYTQTQTEAQDTDRILVHRHGQTHIHWGQMLDVIHSQE
jgi:hypothetical protein